MEFLKSILGDELFNQFVEKINAYNGNEKNTEKIKVGNLASGDYVGKGKYEALEQTLSGKDAEITKANELIAELKKGNKGNEELQGKITEYEKNMEKLQKELVETKIKSAIKVALLSEKAADVDYLTFKLENKLKDENRTLELDENDNIKGWNEMCTDLKTQFPTQFENGGVGKKVEEHKLDTGDDGKTLTRNDILKMPYADRNKLFNENPEGYREAMNK